jgi:hypothetical protein
MNSKSNVSNLDAASTNFEFNLMTPKSKTFHVECESGHRKDSTDPTLEHLDKLKVIDLFMMNE